MPGGTIGKHVRHIYDHFRLLYESYTVAADWIVDYDIRARNNPIETDKLAAIDSLKRMQTMVKDHNGIPLNTPLVLLAAISPQDTNKYQFDSSFGRELFYSCLHAIHHYASIKAICIELGLNPPNDFGMAPSTLQDQMRSR
ncbi:hypothetical protein K501DRAFT_233404 [Backusella circina FSU 941]|nr:hypothetical protein K501DRAFT_233404 [Backusella circina FSU 941]